MLARWQKYALVVTSFNFVLPLAYGKLHCTSGKCGLWRGLAFLEDD
jgi:hypothetical protein